MVCTGTDRRIAGAWFGLVLALGPTQAARGQAQIEDGGLRARPIVAAVLARNAERQAALDGYSSDRVYRLEYHGVGGAHTAQMVVHVEYQAPGVKHFTVISESGSKPLCEKVLRGLVQSEEENSRTENQVKSMVSLDKYDAVLTGEDRVDGMDAWVLDVTPKIASKYAYRGRIWVNKSDFGIMRVVGSPAKNPSWLINHATFDSKYQRVGAFWLAQKNTSVSHVWIGGEATLTIDYGKYAITARPEREEALRHPSAGLVSLVK